MNLIDPGSLYQTIYNLNRFLFDDGKLSPAEKTELANWILAHQNPRRGFIFYPTEIDRRDGLRLFSGEKPRTKLLGENGFELEVLRSLLILDRENPKVRNLCETANRRLFPLCFAGVCPVGECAGASLAFLRYLVEYDFSNNLARFEKALAVLETKRNGKGGWSGFPYYFTLLFLAGLPPELGRAEINYAAGYRRTKAAQPDSDRGEIGRLRKRIVHRALANINAPVGV